MPMPVQPTVQNQPMVASPSSGAGNDVNQILQTTNQLTAGMQATAQQNEQAQKAKEAQKAQKLMQQQYLAALPANQPNASQGMSASGASPTNSPTVMPRSASVPASDPSNPVDQIKGFVANAWNEANQLIANTAQSATQFVTGAPAQAATMPTPAMPNASTSTSTGGGASGNGGFINPLPSGKATSGFGMRNHPVHGGQKMHNGQDLAAPMGTAIQAAADGEVTINAFEGKGYGNWIEIKHPNGKSTRYGHMKDKSPLAVGTKVTQGQVIGAVGSTGASTGPHLHFEIRNSAGKAENPVAYLPNEKSKTA